MGVVRCGALEDPGRMPIKTPSWGWGWGTSPGLKVDFYKALHRSMWDGLFQQSSCDMVSGSEKCWTGRGLEIMSAPG